MSTEASFQRTWDNAGPPKGLVPEAYFAARALAIPATNSLRFAASLSHKSGGNYPAIIAQATNAAGVVTGGQRIFLAHDGKGKAPVDKKLQKMSLGIIKGSMVRLAEPIDGVPLLIGEGVETALTAMQASGYPGGATLGALNPNGVPDGAKDVILLGENDGGKNAAGVAKTAPELLRKGIRVRVAYPPEGFKDFNDIVKDAADQAAAFEAVRKAIEEARDFTDPLDDLVEHAKADPGAPFESEALALLMQLRRDDQPRFERFIARLKAETKCRIGELNKELSRLNADDDRPPAEILVDLATSAENEFFHTDLDDGFAFVNVGEHRETLKIKSRYFTRWLTEKFFRLTGGAPSKPALEQAVATLEAIALFDGDERKVFVRVAAHGDKIYVDLCDAERRVIEIDADGWRVVASAPVHFHRIRGMLPLPVPVAGGSIQLLRPFLNIERANKDSDDPSGQFTLTVGWIVGAFRGNGPYAILVALGEQGAAKTTFCRLMRDLVDPNFAPLRDPPADKRELAISGANSLVLAYDNISAIPDWLSDAWCRRASGAGTGVRELYTDNEEILTNKANPMAANGIAEFVDRPDLAERSIFVNLLPISDDARKTEEDFFADFAAVHPKILGAIFDLLSVGLRRLEEVKKRGLKLPRMADFARWAIACTGEEFGEETFRRNYDENIQDAVSSVLEASPVAQALIVEMEESETGSVALTSSQWLKTLSDRAGKRVAKSRDFPSTPRAMSAQIKRAAGYLRKVGFDVSPSKPSGHKRDRLIAVTRISSFSNKSFEQSSVLSAGAKEDYFVNDANGLSANKGADTEKARSSAAPVIVRGNGARDPDLAPRGPQDSTSDPWEIEY